jgi:hypothetical protein
VGGGGGEIENRKQTIENIKVENPKKQKIQLFSKK